MNDDEEEYQTLFQQHQRIINDQNIQLQLKDEEINQLCIQIEQCQNRLVETQSLVLNLATQVIVVQKPKRQFFTFARRKLENNKKFISIV